MSWHFSGAIFDESNANQERALKEAVREINEFDEDINLSLLIKRIPRDNPYEATKATCDLLENGIVGIFGPFSEDNSNTVQSICDLKEIPHIEVCTNLNAIKLKKKIMFRTIQSVSAVTYTVWTNKMEYLNNIRSIQNVAWRTVQN